MQTRTLVYSTPCYVVAPEIITLTTLHPPIMKIRFATLILAVAILAVAPWVARASSQHVVQLTEADFKEKTQDGKVHFIKFFAPWCGHCKRLAPVWADLGEAFAEDDEVSIASVDCTQHREVCEGAGIQGYPTLKVFFNGAEQEKFQGNRALDSLKTFVGEQKKKLMSETVA